MDEGLHASALLCVLEAGRAVRCFARYTDALRSTPARAGAADPWAGAPAPADVATVVVPHVRSAPAGKSRRARAGAGGDATIAGTEAGEFDVLVNLDGPAVQWRPLFVLLWHALDALSASRDAHPESAVLHRPSVSALRAALFKCVTRLCAAQPGVAAKRRGLRQRLDEQAVDAARVLSRRNATEVAAGLAPNAGPQSAAAAELVELPTFAVMPEELTEEFFERVCPVGHDRALRHDEWRSVEAVLDEFEAVRFDLLRLAPDAIAPTV
jgi:hypothetical protein